MSRDSFGPHSFRSYLVPPPVKPTTSSVSPSVAESFDDKNLNLRFHPSIHPLEFVPGKTLGAFKEENGIQVNDYNSYCILRCVDELMQLCKDLGHSTITQMVKDSSYVGAVDGSRALIQWKSSLIMIDLIEIFKGGKKFEILIRIIFIYNLLGYFCRYSESIYSFLYLFLLVFTESLFIYIYIIYYFVFIFFKLHLYLGIYLAFIYYAYIYLEIKY